MKLKIHPKLVVLVALFFTSMTGIIIRFLESPAMMVVFYRALFTLIIVITMFLFSDCKEEIKTLTAKQVKYIVISGVSFSALILAYIFAVRNTTVACAIVISDIHPILVVIIMILFFKERFDKRAIIGIVTALSGFVAIFATDLFLKTGNIMGDIFALINASSMSVFLTVGGMLRKELSVIPYMLLYNTVSFIVIAIATIITNTSLLGFPLKEYALIFLLAFCVTIIGSGSMNWAMKYLKPSFISTAFLIEPFYAGIAAFIIFNERLLLKQLVGFFIVFIGMIIYSRYENKLRRD